MNAEKNLVKRKRKFREGHWQLTLMLLPAVLLVLIFSYGPMPGIVVAFKNLKFSKGIWGSDWNGLDNFVFLFKSDNMTTLLRNTIGYNMAGLILGNLVPVILALSLERVRKKYAIKIYQTGMFLPYFLSWIIVSYFTLSLFEYNGGIINNIIAMFGGTKIDFYSKGAIGYWPFILIFFAVWKGLGYNTLIYYGTLLGVDPSLYEAATIDGCGYFKKVWHISLPHLIPSIVILLLLSLGGIFKSDYGLYYFIPRDTGVLLRATDTLDTYVFRTLRNATNVGISSAISFMQSIIGFLFVIVGNTLARKVDKDIALF